MQKPLHLLALLHARKAFIVRQLLQLRRILLLQLIVARDIPRADEEDIALAELDLLRPGDLQQLGHGDRVPAHGVVRPALPLHPAVVVQQHAPARDAVLRDGLDAAARAAQHLLRLEVVVQPVQAQVAEVPEAVPLAPGLSVHVVEVVEDAVADGVGGDLVLEGGAVEGWLFGVFEGPARAILAWL